MAMIKLSNCSLDFPVLSDQSHSLRSELLYKVGGNIIKSNLSNHRSFKVRALDNICLTINSGERVGIIGHNGAGKTTLLRLLSGVYPPTSGLVESIGEIQALTDFTLGMDPNATGRSNIYFRLAFMGIGKKKSIDYVESIINFSGLGDFIDLPVRTYSTGMYLRLAFAISTSFDPDILIMDEVIGAGDINFREKAVSRIRTLIAESNILILSSHSLSSIEEFCNRVIVLDKGSILFDGNVEDSISFYKKS